MPVVLPSIKEKSSHWYACLYASRLFLGTISLHLDLLMPSKASESQVGGTTASLEICVILVQLLNADISIILTLFPIFTFCRLVQSLKASSSIAVTLFGMFIEVSVLQYSKVWLSIFVTLFGMVTEVRALQPLKADPPVVVTLFGMFTEVRALQPLKADPPIVVTLFGMVTEVRELQKEKSTIRSRLTRFWASCPALPTTK